MCRPNLSTGSSNRCPGLACFGCWQAKHAEAAGTLHRHARSWYLRALSAAAHHAHPEDHQLPGGCIGRGLVAPLLLCAGLFVQ